MTTTTEVYHVLFCQGWNYGEGEAWMGGRILDGLPTLEEAIVAAQAWARLAGRIFGEGKLYVTTSDHRLAAIIDPDAPSVPIWIVVAGPEPVIVEVA